MKQKIGEVTFSLGSLLCLLFFLCQVAHGVQSNNDEAANTELKEKIRKQILGGTSTRPVDDEYMVGYRDILHVSIYGEGSMDIGGGGQVESPGGSTPGGDTAVDFIRGRGSGIEVRLDGRVSLQHIGDVSVVGMNLSQIRNYLKQLYSTIYDDPNVTVTLIQSNSLQYTVMGQVVSPGLFHLDYPITIVRAVARAGGFTEWADSSITVIRSKSEDPLKAGADKKKGKKFTFDFDDFLKGEDLERNIFIQSGDVLVVH